MKLTRVLLVGLFTLAAVACGPSSGPEGDAAVVETAVTDGSIELDPATVASGPVSFEINNNGSALHEIEVFAGSETDLPVDLGVADTTGLTLVDEVEDIIPGGNASMDLELEPGDYVIICNLPGHYQLGMVTKLTVTD